MRIVCEMARPARFAQAKIGPGDPVAPGQLHSEVPIRDQRRCVAAAAIQVLMGSLQEVACEAVGERVGVHPDQFEGLS